MAAVRFQRICSADCFHGAHDAAYNSIFRGLAASGWYTAALTMRLLAKSELQARRWHRGRRLRRIPLARPVRLGDELRVESGVIEMRPFNSRPEQPRSIRDGKAVQVLVSNLVVPRRVPGSNKERCRRRAWEADGRVLDAVPTGQAPLGRHGSSQTPRRRSLLPY